MWRGGGAAEAFQGAKAGAQEQRGLGLPRVFLWAAAGWAGGAVGELGFQAAFQRVSVWREEVGGPTLTPPSVPPLPPPPRGAPPLSPPNCLSLSTEEGCFPWLRFLAAPSPRPMHTAAASSDPLGEVCLKKQTAMHRGGAGGLLPPVVLSSGRCLQPPVICLAQRVAPAAPGGARAETV